jgi:hypothetical protein
MQVGELILHLVLLLGMCPAGGLLASACDC